MARHVWSYDELRQLRHLYPRFSARIIASVLGLSVNQVTAKASQIGLKKSVEWIAENARQNALVQGHGGERTRFNPSSVPWNKGTHFSAGGRSKHSRFKPGQRPHTWQPIGAESIRDGVLWRKVSEGAGDHSRFDWVAVHRVLWEQHHGPVPAGHVVAFRPGLHTVIADEITLDRLELITRKELQARNSYHRYPAHPQTLSYLEAVFGDEITDEDRAGKQTRSDWLRSQTRGVQNAILGQRKGNAWRAGKVPEFGLRTPWRVLRERLLRQGVDVDALETAAAPPPFVPVATTAPVSDALNLEAHKTRSRALLQLLDQVHTDGSLPKIPIGDLRGAHALGVYAHTLGGDAVHVRLRRGPVLEFTLAHELGHFLDHQALGVRGAFASASHIDLDAWRGAAMGSQAVARWTQERAAAIAAGDRYTRDFLDYLLSPHEIWARSYAQYITVRSGSSMLASQLTDPRMAGLHWTDADFEPIARAIDALLIRKGWRKP